MRWFGDKRFQDRRISPPPPPEKLKLWNFLKTLSLIFFFFFTLTFLPAPIPYLPYNLTNIFYKILNPHVVINLTCNTDFYSFVHIKNILSDFDK